MINLYANFDVRLLHVSSPVTATLTKGNVKCTNQGGPGLRVIQLVIGNITIRYSAYDFLFETVSEYLSFYCFLVISHNIKHNFRQSKRNTVEGYQTVNTVKAGRLRHKCIQLAPYLHETIAAEVQKLHIFPYPTCLPH